MLNATHPPAVPLETDVKTQRWVGVGWSSEAEGAPAGRAAARQALTGGDTKLLLVFASDRYDLGSLLGAVRDSAGSEVPVVGCSTAGEIAAGGARDATVVIIALGGPGFSVATAVGSSASGDLRSAGAAAAACVQEVASSRYRALLLLTDGLAGDQMEIVRGAYGVAGAEVPLVGGCAGDDLRMQSTAQLHGPSVLTDSVVAAAIGSDAPLGIGVRHGWRRVGEPMVVTRSNGNRVYGLDDKPALDVYLEYLGAPPAASADAGAFTRFAATHPLGLHRRSTEEQVRFIGDANFDDRSLGCIAAVPQGASVWLMEGDEHSVLAATDAACTDAVEALGGRAPLGIVAFDCIARRSVLGEAGVAQEVLRITDHADGAAVAGFYTYGEIARTRGMSGFHNQTLVVLAIG
jgi:hypothetical protein